LANRCCCYSFSLAVEVALYFVVLLFSVEENTKINLGKGQTPKLFLPPPKCLLPKFIFFRVIISPVNVIFSIVLLSSVQIGILIIGRYSKEELMDKTANLNLILKIQEKAKNEIRNGDFEMAKFLLLKAEELLISLSL